MSSIRSGLVALLAVSILAAPVLATEIGDPAPALKVAEWVKGDAVKLSDGKGKNVYVVEFWATWCGPCIKGIPHLTKLQKEYKDKGLVVVSISVDRERTLSNVKPFVKEQGAAMGYRVAIDTPAGDSSKAYMEPFMMAGIPSAFLIDKAGKIAWAGHPMELDDVLKQVFAGKWDIAAAKKADNERRKFEMDRAKIAKLADKYFELVTTSDKPVGVEKAGQDLLAAIDKQDVQTLNGLAWTILTNEGVKYRDLKLAMRLAQGAYDACDGKEASVVDTYARALFDTGKVREAVKYQKKAVELAGADDPNREDLVKALKRYEKAAG